MDKLTNQGIMEDVFNKSSSEDRGTTEVTGVVDRACGVSVIMLVILQN